MNIVTPCCESRLYIVYGYETENPIGFECECGNEWDIQGLPAESMSV